MVSSCFADSTLIHFSSSHLCIYFSFEFFASTTGTLWGWTALTSSPFEFSGADTWHIYAVSTCLVNPEIKDF